MRMLNPPLPCPRLLQIWMLNPPLPCPRLLQIWMLNPPLPCRREASAEMVLRSLPRSAMRPSSLGMGILGPLRRRAGLFSMLGDSAHEIRGAGRHRCSEHSWKK